MAYQKKRLARDSRLQLDKHYACPDCGVPMNGVSDHSGIVWICPAAVGEQCFDPATGAHTMPASDPHTHVIYYTPQRIAALVAKGLSYETGPNLGTMAASTPVPTPSPEEHTVGR